MEQYIESDLEKDTSLDEQVPLTLTQRDVLLLKLCVLMANEYSKGGTLHLDTEDLLRKLSMDGNRPHNLPAPVLISPAGKSGGEKY